MVPDVVPGEDPKVVPGVLGALGGDERVTALVAHCSAISRNCARVCGVSGTSSEPGVARDSGTRRKGACPGCWANDVARLFTVCVVMSEKARGIES